MIDNEIPRKGRLFDANKISSKAPGFGR